MNKLFNFLVASSLLLTTCEAFGQNTDNYQEQGGSRWVIGSQHDIASGGEIDFESGSVLKSAGTAITLVKVKKLSISSTPTGSEQDTTWDLPAKSIVIDAFVDVTTKETTGATKTLDIGLLSTEAGGDVDGFADGISVANVGIMRANVKQTVGTNETYLTEPQEIGSLLKSYAVGTDTNGDTGFLIQRPHITSASKSVVYKAGSSDWAEFRGAIYIIYTEVGSPL